MAYVDIERVAALSAEGKAAAAKLQDLRTRKSAEVSARSKQVEALQAKLVQSDGVVNDLVKVRLQREFQRAQIDFQRFSEDAQAEVQEAQQDTLRGFNDTALSRSSVRLRKRKSCGPSSATTTSSGTAPRST